MSGPYMPKRFIAMGAAELGVSEFAVKVLENGFGAEPNTAITVAERLHYKSTSPQYQVNLDRIVEALHELEAAGEIACDHDDDYQAAYGEGYEAGAYELDPNWSSRADGIPNGPARDRARYPDGHDFEGGSADKGDSE